MSVSVSFCGACRIRQDTSGYVGICQHTSAYDGCLAVPMCVSTCGACNLTGLYHSEWDLTQDVIKMSTGITRGGNQLTN